MKKVALSVIRPWVAKKVDEYELDDEVVVEYTMQMLQDTSKPVGIYLSLFSLHLLSVVPFD